MSDIGINSAIYDQIRGHAELIDSVLIGLKAGMQSPEDRQTRVLVPLLRDLKNPTPADLSAQTLAMALREGGYYSPSILEKLATALEQGKDTVWAVEELEKMAQAIEQKRAGTLARMRGWTR